MIKAVLLVIYNDNYGFSVLSSTCTDSAGSEHPCCSCLYC